MPTTPLLTLALLLLVPAQVVDKTPSSVRVQFDEIDGTTVADFLKLMELQLGRSITYEPADVRDLRLLVLGAIEVEPKEFRAFAETLLLTQGLVVSEYGATLFVSRSNGAGVRHKPGFLKSVAPFVPRETLLADWKDRRQVVTTCVTLDSLQSFDVVAMLQSYFTDPMTESVRHLPQANALVLTSHAETIRQAIRLIDALERDAAASAARQASEFEARVKELEEKVLVLESRLGE